MNISKRLRLFLLLLTGLLLLATAGCGGPSAAELAAVDYAPLSRADWPVSTPAEQGLDPQLIAQLYYDAEDVETINSLLVVKNGYLIAEKYFHNGAVDKKDRVQSVTKSYTSALCGIALEQGYLTSLDQKMLDFFPELADNITAPRKREITLREMLQMRAGYPWEESSPELFEMLYHGFWPGLLVDVPLAYDPGTRFEYSNLTAHLVGVIVARAAGTDLRSFAEANLFRPLGVQLGDWITDWEGNYNGHGDIHFNARDMATFGQLYLNGGTWEGKQLVPSQWVADSLKSYSENAWTIKIGSNYQDIGYGYLWWSARAGEHRFNFAWGHGGQQITLLDEYDMVIVVTADPLFGQHGGGPWKYERQNLNLVADFIAGLPSR